MFSRNPLRFRCFHALLFLLVSASGFAQAGELPIQKGPYILQYAERLAVRVEARGLIEPVLEWQQNGALKSAPMAKDDHGIWEGSIPLSEKEKGLRYRIVAKKESSDWITIPAPKAPPGTLEFAVYGDNRAGFGNMQVHKRLLQQMRKDRLALIINVGDLVNRGKTDRNWDQYFLEGKDVLSAIPLYPVMGNHDKSRSNRFGQLFPLGENSQNFYAFEAAPASFIVLNSTINYYPNSAQYKFLERTLQKWKGRSPIFVAIHHPPFDGGKHGNTRKVQKHLVPLFEEYGVDIVFSGHDHNYQRIGPLNGVLYIITGGGGGPLYKVFGQPAIKAFRVLYHFVSVQVDGDMIRGVVKTQNGTIEDRFEFNHRQNPIPKEERKEPPQIRSSRFRLFN